MLRLSSQVAVVDSDLSHVRWAPPGKYLKDHFLLEAPDGWHIFHPMGAVGTIWQTPGSEESAEHFTSATLTHFSPAVPQTAIAKSGVAGRYDYQMCGIAPHIIQSGGYYWMFHSGWSFNSKGPPYDGGNSALAIGVARSTDLRNWTRYPGTETTGLVGVGGTDPCVVRDEASSRWLLYATSDDVLCYSSTDLVTWASEGLACTAAHMAACVGSGNPAESPLVMQHPVSGQWVLILNGGYSVSDDPTDFPACVAYPFTASWLQPVGWTGVWGDGTNLYAADSGAGYAHQIIQFKGQWYMTGVVGTDGHEKLKFTPIRWTATGIAAA